MSKYKLQLNGYVLRVADGTWIPPDVGNSDWKYFQEWVAEGNTPDPVDPPTPPGPP